MNKYFEIFILTTFGLSAGYVIIGVFLDHSLPEMIRLAFGHWWIILPMAAVNAFLQASDDFID